VSSPGPKRPLSRAEDFERFRGHAAKIRTICPMNGQRHFSGVLAGISGGAVCLANGQTTVAIPLEDISKAHLVNYTEKAHVDFGNQTGR
jgi:ribosome maturation factor RimP